MLLVTLALKTLLSISQNGINQITLNKQLGNHFNMDFKMLPVLQPGRLVSYKYWNRIKILLGTNTLAYFASS